MSKILIDKNAMYAEFKLIGQEALILNHYELHDLSPIFSAEEWKTFLSEPDVQKYIKEEMTIIRQSSINKLVQDSKDSNSVGKSQLITALNKIDGEEDIAEGPMMIYCHVPPTDEQRYAPNFIQMDPNGKPI